MGQVCNLPGLYRQVKTCPTGAWPAVNKRFNRAAGVKPGGPLADRYAHFVVVNWVPVERLTHSSLAGW